MKGLIGMGVNYFTDEQIKILKDNPYIEKISYKSIKYSQKFKMEFWSRYSQGEAPSSYFLPLILIHIFLDQNA